MSVMTEEDFKTILESFLQERGFLTFRIPETKKMKRPDYEIARVPRTLTYLGELKSPELNINPATNLYMHLTKIRKLREHTQKAVEQFEKLDPEHDCPRILFFTSTHSQFHGLDLLDALRGYIARNGTTHNDFRQDRVVVSTMPFLNKIDLYIWLQIGSGKNPFQVTYINNPMAKFHDEALSITNELQWMKVSPMGMDQSFFLN